MQVLSSRTRLVYFWVLTLVFLLITPFIVLYASGYRLDKAGKIVKTGGLFVDVGMAGARILLDNIQVFETGFFDKGYFMKDLTPGTYRIRVIRDGFQPWEKEVSVYPQSVTKFMPFLLPFEPRLVPVEHYALSTTTSTSTVVKRRSNAEYDTAYALFSVIETANRKITSTSTVIVENRVALIIDKTGIIAEWQGGGDSFPYFFCEYTTCAKRVRIPTPEDPVVYVDFFPGRNDAILVATPSGVYLVELDGRSGHAMQVLLRKPNSTFRISDKGEIFVKDGLSIYRVEPVSAVVTGS